MTTNPPRRLAGDVHRRGASHPHRSRRPLRDGRRGDPVRVNTTRVWKNAPPTLRDLFLMGRAHGQREFVVYEGDRATYDGWARATLALAAELQAQGVKKGDRVALVMRNLPEWPVCFFAAVITGAIITPLNAWWTGAGAGIRPAGFRLQDRHPRRERYERLGEHLANCPDLKRIYVARARPRPASWTISPIPACKRLEDVIGAVNALGIDLPEGRRARRADPPR